LKYEIVAHLPTQIEYFLQILNQGGNEKQIEASINTIKDIINDSEFSKTLDNYKKTLDTQIKQKEDGAIQKIKNNTNTLNEIIQIVNDAVMDITLVGEEYLNNVRSFILRYTKSLDIGDS